MGTLVNQPIKALFNGVSQQPDTIRLSSQMTAVENALLTVVNGFEKRPPSRYVAKLTVDNPAAKMAVHSINRDASEKYLVVIRQGAIEVFNTLTGVKQTVNVIGTGTADYINTDPDNLSFVTVADYTFICNRGAVVTMAPAAASGVTIYGPAKTYKDLPQDNVTLPTYLNTATYDGTGKWHKGSSLGFSIGNIWKLEGENGDPKGVRYLKCDTDYSWIETVDPNGVNDFDARTMPHELVSLGGGVFEFRVSTWNTRTSGDEETAKPPRFVNRKIADVFFYRNRLGFCTDENVVLSYTGDVFNFWPEKAFDPGDSDPIDLQAPGNSVNILRHAVPFNRSLFATADECQFEVSSGSGPMTPTGGQIDASTKYQADPRTKPFVMGNELYFASKTPGSAQVMEYYYEDASVANVANAITKHCPSYLPQSIAYLLGDPNNDMLAVLGDEAGERDKLYVYRAYWEGDEKKQSAWARWTFGGYIHGIAVIGSTLYLVIRRQTAFGDNVFIESVSLDTEPVVEGLGHQIFLDQRVKLTGTYDAPSNKTTWTLPYGHSDDVVVVVAPGFVGAPAGRVLGPLEYPTANTVRVVGNFSTGFVYIGKRYRQECELSKQYLRENNGDGAAIINGRLQLKDITFSYKDSGYFEVHVTPEYRETRVYQMTGRILGSGSNTIGSPAIATGFFKAKVKSRADTVTIKVVNDSHLPCTLTSAAWVGFFNEITRQEG